MTIYKSLKRSSSHIWFMAVESLLIQLSYFGLFILMVAVGILGFFPPSKVIYALAGYFVFTGDLSLALVLVIGALGHATGNYVQYELARQKGLAFFKKTKIVPILEIRKIQVAFNKRPKLFLFVGKLLDPIKLFISICAGIVSMNRAVFFLIVFLGSLIWALIFTLLGYYFGRSYDQFGYVGVVIVLLGFLVMAYFYKLMNSEEVLKKLEQ